MNKFITVLFSFILSAGGVGYVYVADQLEAALAAHQPTGHDIEAEMEQYALQKRFDRARSQGEVEELFPNS